MSRFSEMLLLLLLYLKLTSQVGFSWLAVIGIPFIVTIIQTLLGILILVVRLNLTKRGK